MSLQICQTFTFQLFGKSKNFKCDESQINLKKVFSLILEEVRYMVILVI